MNRDSAPARARLAVLALCVVLIALIWTWQWALEPSWPYAAWALMCSLPMLAPLPGLWHGNRRTYAWATLCLTPYLVAGITEAIVNARSRPWASATLGVSVLLFFSLIAFLRASAVQPANAARN